MKTGMRARLMDEAKSVFIIFVYLTVLLGAFTTYRRLLLAEYRIPYFQYGFSIVEALILSKVIVFGRFLRIGERYKHKPLIIPTLHKTFCFSILILLFSLVEHFVIGWMHGKPSSTIYEEIFAQGYWEILARLLMLFTTLVPLFAVWETSRILGEGKLYELFFTPRDSASPNQSSQES
jgi:hypothetical protein